MHTLKNILKFSAAAISLVVFSGTVQADDIEDSISEGLQYYQDGGYKDAAESLSYATQLIRQKESTALEAFLPDALEGWSAQAPVSQSVDAAMFGGGITVERAYDKGASYITIRIVSDSPIMQSIIMMFSNPMFATADGGKLERIGRQKAIVKYEPRDKMGDINIVVAKRFLVTIEGRDVSAEELKAYAGAIDYKMLKDSP